jgi:hypothetical protein
MRFAFQGFTQDDNKRCFLFHGIEESNEKRAFRITIELALLMRNHVSLQDGPLFCLQLLTKAYLAGPSYLEGLQQYRVSGDDFRSLLVERERQAAEKSARRFSAARARRG